MNPRTRALVTVGLIITILTLFFIFIFIRQQNQELSNNLYSQQATHEKLMALLLAQTSQNYKSRIKSMVKNRVQVMKSFAAQDRDKLFEQAKPLSTLLKKENPYFRTIFFINNDNIGFLRVLKPKFYGDDISSMSPLVVECNIRKKILEGFEIVKGGLLYRVVHPVFVDKKYIGVLGFSIDANFFLDQVSKAQKINLPHKDQNITQVALAVPKDRIKKAVFMNKQYTICDDCILFTENKPLFQKLPDSIDLKRSFQRIKIEGINYALIHSVRFQDFTGKVIARGISLIKTESYVTNMTRTLIKTMIFVIVLLLAAFIVLYLNFNILFKKINTLTRSLEQSNKELEAQVKRRTAKLQEEIIAKKHVEEELKVIFKTIPDPIVVYNGNGYPLYLNQAFTDVFGWHLNEIQGVLIPFVPEDQKQLTLDKIKEIYNSRDPVRFETQRLTKHGELLDIFLSAAVLRDFEGINDGIVVNLKDITEQKRIEIQLRQSQKMEAVGTLAGGIAHDFNNILSGIFGYTQLAKMNLDNPEKAREKIEQIFKGAKRASELVQQILTFSRHSDQTKKKIALFEIVKDTVKFLRSSIPTTIEIQEEIISKAAILADATQTRQIIMNLCTNASHSMEDAGGILSISLKDIAITRPYEFLPYTVKLGNYVKLEIKDTGCGMDREILDRIFDPYFTTKEVGKGTGLGLAVVDGIIKKHHGFIKTFSKPGFGSKFQIFWPVIEKDDYTDIIDKAQTSLANGTENVMIVDDETDILYTSQAILEKQGYMVTTFVDGKSALESFTKNPDFFDVIVTDMTMPGLTGDLLAKKVLQIKKGMPIILCTGFSEIISREKTALIGIKGYLSKPFAVHDLAMKIRELLDTSE